MIRKAIASVCMINNGINLLVSRERGSAFGAVVYPCAVPLRPASE